MGGRTVLVGGIGIADPTLAFWLGRYGYSVTLGIVREKSNTLPARRLRISPPLISLDFSGLIQGVHDHHEYSEFSSDNAIFFDTGPIGAICRREAS